MNITLQFNDFPYLHADQLIALAKLLGDDNDDDFTIEDAYSALITTLEVATELSADTTAPQPHAELTAQVLNATRHLLWSIWHGDHVKTEHILEAESDIADVIAAIRQGQTKSKLFHP